MKKNVLVFGSIAGLIVSSVLVFGLMLSNKNGNFENGMCLGYSSMLIAFSFIFVGIKNFRDKYNNGTITFGKAFQIGLYIALIASTIYVAAWLIEYYLFIPDFMEKYTTHIVNTAKTNGATQIELDKQIAEMAGYKEMYKNPLFVILLTYAEILPLGLIVTLICSLILKRKPKDNSIADIN